MAAVILRFKWQLAALAGLLLVLAAALAYSLQANPLPPALAEIAVGESEHELLARRSGTEVPIGDERLAPEPDAALAPPKPTEAEGLTELKIGTVVNAVMLSAMDGDLPGLAVAQVSSHVRDTRTGLHVLIPAGAKIIGEYRSRTAVGQPKTLVVWRRIQFADGATLELPPLPTAPASGQDCKGGKADSLCPSRFGASPMMTALDPAAPPGHSFQILISQDLALRPYGTER